MGGTMKINAPGTIRLRLRELSQLFNSMDPSPFNDRDLDADAEEFIVSWARELPPEADLELVIHLPAPALPERLADVQGAVRQYFTQRAEDNWREFRLLMRRGRISLIVGLLFLGMCLFISELFAKFGDSTFTHILRESFTIGGWVAMWRPLEIYLYDWWPLRADGRVFRRLSGMPVRIVLPEPPARSELRG
jgi:hypothetical protein